MNIFEVKAFTNNLYFFYQINYSFRAFSRKLVVLNLYRHKKKALSKLSCNFEVSKSYLSFIFRPIQLTWFAFFGLYCIT